MKVKPSFVMNFFAALFLLFAVHGVTPAYALSLACFGLAIIGAINGD